MLHYQICKKHVMFHYQICEKHVMFHYQICKNLLKYLKFPLHISWSNYSWSVWRCLWKKICWILKIKFQIKKIDYNFLKPMLLLWCYSRLTPAIANIYWHIYTNKYTWAKAFLCWKKLFLFVNIIYTIYMLSTSIYLDCLFGCLGVRV